MSKPIKKSIPSIKVIPKKITPAKTVPSQNQRGKIKSKSPKDLTR